MPLSLLKSWYRAVGFVYFVFNHIAFLPVTPQNPKKSCFAVKFSGEALAEYFCPQVPQAWMAQVH